MIQARQGGGRRVLRADPALYGALSSGKPASRVIKWGRDYHRRGGTEYIRLTEPLRQLEVLRATSAMPHVSKPVEILYVAANHRWCTIHTVKGEVIPARMSTADFARAVGEGFVSVHRSYVLNAAYITLVRPYCAVLENGAEIPIPVKKLQGRCGRACPPSTAPPVGRRKCGGWPHKKAILARQ